MGRKRSTWNGKRNADPYTMNQERNHPPVTDYMIGDPSAFGEDVHQDLPDDPALGRNEIGMPNLPASNLNHKDSDEWNSADPYDNANTFSPADRDRKETPDVPIDQMNDRKVANQSSPREVFASLQKKAFLCTKIAEAMLPGAPQSLIEEQSYELMALPDEFVTAAIARLAADDEDEKEEKEDKKEEEDHDDDDKEEKEDEDKKESKKKSSPSFSDESVEAMLREMMDEEEDEETEAMLREMMNEEAGMPQEGTMHMHGGDLPSEDDPEIDAMLQDMMQHGAMNMDEAGMGYHASTEFDIGMNPMMDVTSSELLAQDDTLQNLFNNTIPKEIREANAEAAAVQANSKTASRGVHSLGGRVKEAADTEEDLDLSKLWRHDPDISGNL